MTTLNISNVEVCAPVVQGYDMQEVCRGSLVRDLFAGKLASLIRSWQSIKGTFRASGLAGIEPMPSKSE